MHNEYLKKYADRYRVFQNEDMIWEIATRHKTDEWNMMYSVYQFSDTHLAAMLPQKTGLSLSRRFPDVFRIHQHAQDGVSLVFEEGKLHEVADALHIRRRKQISAAERARLSELSQKHSGEGLRMIAEQKLSLTESDKPAQELTLSQNTTRNTHPRRTDA